MIEPLVLRPYQAVLIDEARHAYAGGARALLMQGATGLGKAVVIAAVKRGALARGRRGLILVHRRELVRQMAEKLAWAGVPHGIIAAGFARSPKNPVEVAAVDTARRRLGALGQFDLVVIDECHHSRAATWRRVIDSQPSARLLGCTATPARLDGKGLGIAAGGMFDELLLGPPVTELIAGGYLSSVRAFVPQQRLNLLRARVRAGDYVESDIAQIVDRPQITGDAIEQYRRRANHQPAIAFCVTVAHAEHVADAFRQAGYRAECVHGKSLKAHRDRVIHGLGTGEVEVLTNCRLIDEGVDVPALGCVILLRPTKSLVLHFQMIGRGMRPAPGKSALIVLDHVGNVLTHGLPEQERHWTLDGVDKLPGEAPLRICPECGAANPISATECVVCGFEFPKQSGRGPDEVEGELAEITGERLAELAAMSYRRMQETRLSETELRADGEIRGYKPGWVWHMLRERETAARRRVIVPMRRAPASIWHARRFRGREQ